MEVGSGMSTTYMEWRACLWQVIGSLRIDCVKKLKRLGLGSIKV